MRRTCSTARARASSYGSAEMLDHMAWDGLTNPYDKQAMGVFGERASRSMASPAKSRTRSPPRPCIARRRAVQSAHSRTRSSR